MRSLVEIEGQPGVETMDVKKIERRIQSIVQLEGRRPRILLAPLEGDPSDRWTKPLAAALAQFGFDVDIGPAGQSPIQAARLAIDNDVHIICVSVNDISHQPLVVQLIEALETKGGTDIRRMAGGAGAELNHAELRRAGVDLIVDFAEPNINLINLMLDLIDETGKKGRPTI